jgi:hypothetical protein
VQLHLVHQAFGQTLPSGVTVSSMQDDRRSRNSSQTA